MDIKDEAVRDITPESLLGTTPASDPAGSAPITQPVISAPNPELEEGMVPEIPTTHRGQPKDKRFNEIYYKSKEYERMKPEFDTMKRELSEMKSSLTAVNVSSINSELNQIQVKYKEALTNGDYDSATNLNSRMVELMASKKIAEDRAGSPRQSEPPVPLANNPMVENFTNQYNQPYIPPEAIVAVQIFEQNNPWYGEDKAMTATMDVFASSIKEDPEWAEKSFSSQLNESLRRVKKAFPNKFRQAVPPSAVGGVVPVNPAPATGVVTLTAEEEAFVATLNPANPTLAREEYINSKKHYGGKLA